MKRVQDLPIEAQRRFRGFNERFAEYERAVAVAVDPIQRELAVQSYEPYEHAFERFANEVGLADDWR